MTLEAVWFKDGKEIAWVDPVFDFICADDVQNISEIEVCNEFDWYTSKNLCDETPDYFVIRIKKED